jgi:glycosyltransferase involved in cell wall biosynthesis
MGHEVKVIHYRSVFPTLFYFIARLFKTLIKKIFKTDFIPFHKLKSAIHYEMDGVKITSEPIFKLVPHIRFSNSVINRKTKKIVKDNQESNFIPDAVIGHFLNPQLQIFNSLRNFYPKIKFSLVFHENPIEIAKLYGLNVKKYLRNIDYIGFRFEKMQHNFESIFGSEYSFFLCPSGIPEDYILHAVPPSKFKNPKLSIAFVGMLIPLKNVDVTLSALVKAFPQKNFSFKLIGEGMMLSNIVSQIKEFELTNNVILLGKKSRLNVQDELMNTDVFVMVSSPEAFGLVYLEAMGKGCISIGTKGQGIDGVIKHGENGFLCDSRNVQALADILLDIQRMTFEEKMSISERAMQTARDMTDQKVALSYLKKIGLV